VLPKKRNQAYKISSENARDDLFIWIYGNGHKINFVVVVPQNQEPVTFEIVKTTENSLRGENPNHDFPTFISYSLVSEGHLLAEIGNQLPMMRFEFVRVVPKDEGNE